MHSQLLIKNDVIKNEDNQTTLNLNEISLLMKLLIEAYQNLRNTPIDSLPVEIALIEFYNKIEGKKL